MNDGHGPSVRAWCSAILGLVLKGLFLATYAAVFWAIEIYCIAPLPLEAQLLRYELRFLEVIFFVATVRSVFSMIFGTAERRPPHIPWYR